MSALSIMVGVSSNAATHLVPSSVSVPVGSGLLLMACPVWTRMSAALGMTAASRDVSILMEATSVLVKMATH